MISKEAFVQSINLILEQEEINRQFEKALTLVGNGNYVFGTENKFLEAAMLLLKEGVHDQYGYIDWWFYDATPDYLVWTDDGAKEWCLKEPADLYDFIVNECH